MIDRPSYLNAIRPFMGKNIIKVLVGVRRCGKSTLLSLIKNRILADGADESTVTYLNFESAQTAGIRTKDELLAYMAERIDPSTRHYAFFDEIQQVAGWEKALAALMVDYDIDLYITGSNAHMLSSDLATYITGRYVRIPVFPFSFSEFFDAYASSHPDASSREAFSHYLIQGGFPFQTELAFDEEPSLQYLNDVYSTILFKDLVQRNDIRNAEQLELIIRYVLQEIGHPFSAKSIADYLKSERRSVSADTIYAYLNAAEGACLLHRVPREDAKGKRALKFNEKLYAVDHGLREALGYSNASSIDQVLENIVYMELVRRGYDVRIGKIDDKEIDFIARKRNDTHYIQVCYLLASDSTIEREFSSLESVKDNFPKLVLSLDEFPRERNGIKSANLIDWLLGDEISRQRIKTRH